MNDPLSSFAAPGVIEGANQLLYNVKQKLITNHKFSEIDADNAVKKHFVSLNKTHTGALTEQVLLDACLVESKLNTNCEGALKFDNDSKLKKE